MTYFSFIFSILMFYDMLLFGAYDLSVCAIFQDEAPYLKEWIEFHKLQGVQHFYLYNNNSQDNYLEVLAPYILSDEVTLVQWPYTYERGEHADWIKIQCGAYTDCIRTHEMDTQWLAVIDIDEFLFCPNGDRLPKFLESYLNYGGVCVSWLSFGTSDIEDIPPGFCMIELLIRRAKLGNWANKSVKSIVQPKWVKDCQHPHYCSYTLPFFAVTPDKIQLVGGFSEVKNIQDIRIHHYWTRTIRHFLSRKIDSKQKRGNNCSIKRFWDIAALYNEEEDATILRYVEELRKALGIFQGSNP